MSKLLKCEEVVHNENYLSVGGLPTPPVEFLVVYKATYPPYKDGSVKSETRSKKLCTDCYERVEKDISALVKHFDKVDITMEVSTI